MMANKSKGERKLRDIPPIPDTFENMVKTLNQPAPKLKDKKDEAQ